MRTRLAITGALAVTVAWGGLVAGQVTQLPGPGSGVVTVQGAVSIVEFPPLDVGQRGDWKVTLVGQPFLKVDTRYRVTWPSGETESFAVAQVAGEGWVRPAGPGRARWVNLNAARAVEEIP